MTSSDGEWLGSGLCFSGDTLLPTRPLSIAVTALFCCLTVLPCLPQYLKFHLRCAAVWLNLGLCAHEEVTAPRSLPFAGKARLVCRS